MWNVPLRVGGSLSDSSREGGATLRAVCRRACQRIRCRKDLMGWMAAADTHMTCRREMQRISQRSVDEALLSLLVQPVVNFSPYHQLHCAAGVSIDSSSSDPTPCQAQP